MIVTNKMIDTKKLIEVRKNLWFSQTELAHKIWVKVETIWRYEHNKWVNIKNIERMVEIFNEWRTNGQFVCKSTTKFTLRDFIK